jgi:hypothetical protein
MRFPRLFGLGCKDPCRNNRRLKRLAHAGSRIIQTRATISATGLVIASAGFGAVYAWTVGPGQVQCSRR